MTVPPSSIRSRELGRHLRWAQERAGLSGVELATMLGWTVTALSRTLTGRRVTKDVDVAALLAVCRVIGAERERLLELCHPTDDPGLLRLADDRQWSAYLAHAGAAVRLVEFAPFSVPWLVQVPDYTRALLADSPMVPANSLEERVAARRAAVELVRVPTVEVFLHEWLLRTPVHGAEVMSEQLHHLLSMSVRPSLSIRVLPIGHGVHVCGGGPFTLLEFADHLPVVYREDHAAGVLVDHPNEVRTCRSVVGQLDSVALDEQRSRELIAEVAAALYVDAAAAW
jgi:transcriptional regulator with XRE-family HTH domain